MPQSVLKKWMHRLLKLAGVYNITAGLCMILFYHEGFKALGTPKPEMNLPIQLVGVMVLLFGVGYLMVDRNPSQNRNVLLLGMLSKLIGPVLAIGYIARGELPIEMLVVLVFADLIYLVPFWMIYQRIGSPSNEFRELSDTAVAKSKPPQREFLEPKAKSKSAA